MSASLIQCEKFFRDLSGPLSTDWEKVATQCGILSGKIHNIRENFSRLEERVFQFLTHLRQRFPDLADWSGKLRTALSHEDRNDLVEMLDNFILEVKEDATNEDFPDCAPPSSSPRRPLGECSKNGENLKSTPKNLINKESKPEGATAKKSPNLLPRNGDLKCKRKLSNDGKENTAGSCFPAEKTKKTKKTKPTIKPLPLPLGTELMLIKDINEEGSHNWCIKAWSDHGWKESKKGENNYNCHGHLRDESEQIIFATIFYKLKKDCEVLRKFMKDSTETKPLHLRRLKVQKVTDPKYQNKAGESNYKLVMNEHTEIYEV